MPADRPVAVIDLFAGPGGLGEGFAALGTPRGSPKFKIRLSIEKDPLAHQTLELRAFFRHFEHGGAPEDYYRFLRGQLSRENLFDAWPIAANTARAEACCAKPGAAEWADVRGAVHDMIGKGSE